MEQGDEAAVLVRLVQSRDLEAFVVAFALAVGVEPDLDVVRHQHPAYGTASKKRVVPRLLDR